MRASSEMRESDCVPIEARNETNFNLKLLRLPDVPSILITTATEMNIERTGGDDDAYRLVCSADDFRRYVFVSLLTERRETRESIKNHALRQLLIV